MLLGKRPRGPIKRTTSMTGIDVDPTDVEAMESSDPPQDSAMNGQRAVGGQTAHGRTIVVGGPSGFDHRLMATVSPRYDRRSSAGGDHIVVETAHFLRTCGLCKRSLAPGRDIYMYRGDTAFCSLECREQQMKHDERKRSALQELHRKMKMIAAATTTTSSQHRQQLLKLKKQLVYLISVSSKL